MGREGDLLLTIWPQVPDDSTPELDAVKDFDRTEPSQGAGSDRGGSVGRSARPTPPTQVPFLRYPLSILFTKRFCLYL